MNNVRKILDKFYLKDNYEILDFDSVNNNSKKKQKCYVFFSSNRLYEGRDNINNIIQMHESGRYEWKYISANKRLIKNYIKGINERTNTVDKIKIFY